jgi:hypothetical protein
VERQRIDEADLVALPRQDPRIDSGAAADVKDARGRLRQKTIEQLERPDELEPGLSVRDEPTLLGATS